MVLQFEARIAQPFSLGVDVTSVRGRFLIFTAVHCEEIFQFPLQRLERGPSHWVPVPALKHDVVQCGRAIRRRRHSVAVLDLVQHLRIRHSCNKTHLST